MKALLCFALFACAVLALPLPSVSGKSYVTQNMVDAAQKLIESAANETSNLVYERLAYVCDTFGPRFSGTPGLEKAMDHILELMRDDGLEVYEEPTMIPKWVRGKESLRMVEPSVREKDMMMVSMGSSVGTGGKPLKAEVLVVKSFDDLKEKGELARGKIVVYNAEWKHYGNTVQHRSHGAVEAFKYGAVAALTKSIAPYGIQTVHAGSSEPSSIPMAAITLEDALLMQRMQDRGQRIWLELSMEAHTEPDVLSRSIIAQVRGSEKPDEVVVFGGHIDSWDIADGATDDGGGAFGSWEAVRRIHALGLKPKRTVRTVLFVNEENGAAGGRQYLQDHQNEMDRTSLALEMDEGNFQNFGIGFSGSDEAFAVLEEIGSKLLHGMGAGNVTKGGGGTDISFMCQQGVPCAGFEVQDPRAGLGATNNPCADFVSLASLPATLPNMVSDGYMWYHHTSADTVDKIDANQLRDSATALSVWAFAVADLEDLLPR